MPPALPLFRLVLSLVLPLAAIACLSAIGHATAPGPAPAPVPSTREGSGDVTVVEPEPGALDPVPDRLLVPSSGAK